MSDGVKFTKLHPLADYSGAQPVYRVRFAWPNSVDCYVRRTEQETWETAPATSVLACAEFTECPTGDANMTRYSAVAAFDYYHNV
jgi:hypothetical protein